MKFASKNGDAMQVMRVASHYGSVVVDLLDGKFAQ